MKCPICDRDCLAWSRSRSFIFRCENEHYEKNVDKVNGITKVFIKAKILGIVNKECWKLFQFDGGYKDFSERTKLDIEIAELRGYSNLGTIEVIMD